MKVIRDNVHEDIELSPAEMSIIHTRGFQRLHGCRQLGLTHLIYPGAKHSRFEHVLGVMQVATKIGKALKERGEFFTDPKDDFTTDSEGILLGKLLRLAALLHDMGHVPFGHTLEDEMPVIPKHDEPSHGKQHSRMDDTVSEVLRSSGNAQYVEPVLRVLRAISESKNDKTLYTLVDSGEIPPEYLVLADIIGNTICADLLDYIIRDHMMTGISATYDDRIFQYFGVGEHSWNEKPYKRIVIKLVRNGRFRKDALADLLDILKLRYNLSDKVLFHPKKCSADAMLIKAVSGSRLVGQLMHYSDDALLHALRNNSLVRMIQRRDLFNPVFSCGPDDISIFSTRAVAKEDVILELHRNTNEIRTRIEQLVEERLGFPSRETSVLIYCPRPKMTLKPVLALVQWKDNTVRRLNEIPASEDTITADQIGVLQDIYPRLWRLYLFVHPKLRCRGSEIRAEFLRALKDETGLTARCDPALENYLEVGCFDYKIGKMLDKELGGREGYSKMPATGRHAAWKECFEKVSASPDGLRARDDRFEDATPAVELASRDEGGLKRRMSHVVDSVLRAHSRKESTKRQRGHHRGSSGSARLREA